MYLTHMYRSLVGTGIIVVTFLGSRAFRAPINRLVFYASWVPWFALRLYRSRVQCGYLWSFRVQVSFYCPWPIEYSRKLIHVSYICYLLKRNLTESVFRTAKSLRALNIGSCLYDWAMNLSALRLETISIREQFLKFVINLSVEADLRGI